jgi:hypothetical protein
MGVNDVATPPSGRERVYWCSRTSDRGGVPGTPGNDKSAAISIVGATVSGVTLSRLCVTTNTSIGPGPFILIWNVGLACYVTQRPQVSETGAFNCSREELIRTRSSYGLMTSNRVPCGARMARISWSA